MPAPAASNPAQGGPAGYTCEMCHVCDRSPGRQFCPCCESGNWRTRRRAVRAVKSHKRNKPDRPPRTTNPHHEPPMMTANGRLGTGHHETDRQPAELDPRKPDSDDRAPYGYGNPRHRHPGYSWNEQHDRTRHPLAKRRSKESRARRAPKCKLHWDRP